MSRLSINPAQSSTNSSSSVGGSGVTFELMLTGPDSPHQPSRLRLTCPADISLEALQQYVLSQAMPLLPKEQTTQQRISYTSRERSLKLRVLDASGEPLMANRLPTSCWCRG